MKRKHGDNYIALHIPNTFESDGAWWRSELCT